MDDTLPGTDEMGDGFLSLADDGDQKKVAILLVANRDVDKRGVVDSLTGTGTWDDRKVAVDSSENGVRVLTCTSPERVVVDTTPLKISKGKSLVAIARRWISRNCLRRILRGKEVLVVCVLTCRVRKTCKSDIFTYSSCWVEIFSLIFKAHRAAIMVLVNKEGVDNVPQETQDEVAEFVHEHGLSPKNIIYSNLTGGDKSVRALIEESVRQRNLPDKEPERNRVCSSGRVSEGLDAANDGKRPPRWKSCWQPKGRPDKNCSGRTVMPFPIKETFSDEHEALTQKEKLKQYEGSDDREKYDSWGPERVILFGRAGSGKSTLAQMLTLGKLCKDNMMFSRSSGVRGASTKVQSGVGRGWYVLDTPGFGEPNDGTVPTGRVQVKITDHVRVVEGTFSHYIYVWKKARLDCLDQSLWGFFTALFGAEISRQFTVVVSDADQNWIRDNRITLEEYFEGCKHFLSAEFPDIDSSDDEVESENEIIREESLSRLEESLAVQNRTDVFCKQGKYARINIRMETEHAYLELDEERNERIKFLVRGVSVIFACCNLALPPCTKLTNRLRVDHVISVEP